MQENKNYIPVPIQYMPCEEDEIDLKEIIKTLIKYKKLIIGLTLSITLLAIVYALSQKPIYEIKTNIQTGYINITTPNGISQLHILSPEYLQTYINTTFDHSHDKKNPFPIVKASLLKNSKNIITIKIQHTSNQNAKNSLNNIINNIKSKEDKKLQSYINNISNQIKILQTQKDFIKQQIQSLEKSVKNNKDMSKYQNLITTLSQLQNKYVKVESEILSLKERISPINISKTTIIGKIIQQDYPVKPKKKLIVIVAFVTSFILSIFLVFFIEFIKSLKDEN